MALADFLQQLLRQPGGPQMAMSQAASDQGSAGPNGSAAYQNALQAAFQQQGAPQAAPQGVSSMPTGSVASQAGNAPMAAPAVSAPASGGNALSGLFTGLQSILDPQARGRNQTIQYLTQKGYDPGTAQIIASDKPLLRQALIGGGSDFDKRAKAAQMYGLQPGTEDFRNFVLTGKLDSGSENQTSDIKDYNFYVQQEKTAGRQPEAFNDWRIQGKRAGATNISDIGNTKGETTYDQNLGKNLADKTVSIMDAGMQAPNKIATYQMMKNALANVYQGAGGDTVQNLRRVASSLGFDVDKVGDGDLVQSLSNQLALQMRNPSGGAGMPGAMSDSDREFLKATVPGLGRTPEGNAQLIDYMTRIEQRNMDVAKMAQTYMSQNGGRLDYKFFNQVADWSKQNPLFPEKAKFATPTQMPKSGDVIDGYRFKGGNPADRNSWEKD